MVDRWTVKGWNDDHIEVVEDAGKWVRYSDYEALAAELDRAQNRIRRYEAFEKKLWDRNEALEARAEAAERLAGARVKALRVDQPHRPAFQEAWNGALDAVLSALAEPAGEVDPRQFLPTEDGEFNGNTFSDDPVPFGWITQSAYDRVNYSSLPEEVTIIRNAVGPTGMPRVALYTTPPDASAIRGALEAALETMKRYKRAGYGDDVFMSDLCRSIRTAEAALTGAKP